VIEFSPTEEKNHGEDLGGEFRAVCYISNVKGRGKRGKRSHWWGARLVCRFGGRAGRGETGEKSRGNTSHCFNSIKTLKNAEAKEVIKRLSPYSLRGNRGGARGGGDFANVR